MRHPQNTTGSFVTVTVARWAAPCLLVHDSSSAFFKCQLGQPYDFCVCVEQALNLALNIILNLLSAHDSSVVGRHSLAPFAKVNSKFGVTKMSLGGI